MFVEVGVVNLIEVGDKLQDVLLWWLCGFL